jgi:hypothetical protein
MDNNNENLSKSRKIINEISSFINKYITVYFKENSINDKNDNKPTNNNSIIDYNDITESNCIILHKIYDNNINRITENNIDKLINNQKLYTELAKKLNNLQ